MKVIYNRTCTVSVHLCQTGIIDSIEGLREGTTGHIIDMLGGKSKPHDLAQISQVKRVFGLFNNLL
jgi:hypothetical protein